MKHATKRALLVFSFAWMLTITVHAQEPAPPAGAPHAVPRLVKFSGSLPGEWNQSSPSLVGITFALYREQEGGASLWLETQNVEADAEGRYSVLLGATRGEGLPVDLFLSGEARWLGIQVKGQPEQRVLLVAVPYAFKAADADQLGGRPASDYLLAPANKASLPGSPSANSLGGVAPFYTATTMAGPSLISLATSGPPLTVASAELVSNLNADLLDGMDSSAFASTAGLDTKVSKAGDTMTGTLNLDAAGTGLSVTNNSTVGGTLGVTGALTGSTGAFNSGATTLAATTSSTGSLVPAVLGQAVGGSGLVVGVKGVSTLSLGGIGMRGEGNNIGVEGVSASGFGVGVQGSVSDQSGSNFGVIGTSDSSVGIGVRAAATRPTGTAHGLDAIAASPNGTAGFFENTAGFVSGAAPGAILQGLAAGQLKFTLDGLGNLTTRGDIKLGPSPGLFAASGIENFGILRGTVGNTGVITQGAGFAVMKNGTGDYTVSFNTAYSGVPTAVATAHSTLGAVVNVLDISATSFRVLSFAVSGGGNQPAIMVAADSPFTFFVLGPR